jgi:hypothetical protein
MKLGRRYTLSLEPFVEVGAVLRLLKRPSNFLLVSLIFACPRHVRDDGHVMCSRSGARPRRCYEAEFRAVVSP